MMLWLIYIAGLAIDWINDRVYWVERRSRQIRVYDMNTEEILLVSFLPFIQTSASNKLKILPHLGYIEVLLS